MIRKILTYIGFTATSLLEVFTFVSADSYVRLGMAVLFYPLLACFAYQVFFANKKDVKTPTAPSQPPSPSPNINMEAGVIEDRNNVVIADLDKRAFLKLIGTAGISFFLFSLLNRKTGTSFLGGPSGGSGLSTLKNSAGQEIDPAERQPTDGYRISEVDDSGPTDSYFGFINNSGAWFIMKEDIEGSFRYTRGTKDFPKNWVSHENLTYDYYFNVFP